MLVHIHEYILDANLLAVANAPDRIELETLDDGTLEDEDRRGTRTTDEVDALRIELGDG